jgi:uncharacterized membrane protein
VQISNEIGVIFTAFDKTSACGGVMNQPPKDQLLSAWLWYAIGAAVLYGLHQIFTKPASEGISDGLGGFVVEGTAAMTILANGQDFSLTAFVAEKHQGRFTRFLVQSSVGG